MWTTFEIFFKGMENFTLREMLRDFGDLLKSANMPFVRHKPFIGLWFVYCSQLKKINIDADGDHCVINGQWICSAQRRVTNKISLNQWAGNELPHSLSFGSTYPTKVSHKFNPVGVSPKKIHSTDLHCSVLFYTTSHSTSFCLFFGEISVYGNLVWICCWSWHKARKL